MPIARLPIPKTTWGKLKSKLERPEHQGTAQALNHTRQSTPPAGGAVLWEPDRALLDELRAILEREETFVRRKGTCSHQELQATIEKMREFKRDPSPT